MEVDDFSRIQMSIFAFFENKVKKSLLFKAKKKVDKKIKDLEKNIDNKKKQEELRQLERELKIQRKASLSSEIPNFLTECSNKAISVGKPMYKVTHPTKFTNGLIPYGGIFIESCKNKASSYLTTKTLDSSYFDISNSNGNLVTHARFMMQKLDNETVYEKLEKSDNTWLFEFTKSKEQVRQWQEGLALWVAESDLKNAYGLKQNYFYLSDDIYHLTAPLFPSSLCQGIYSKIYWSKFSKENTALRKARSKKTYVKDILVEYPDLAIMHFGGTQPQNISTGNFERHGEAFLLTCAPPKWKSKIKPPINLKSLYKGEFDHSARKMAKKLQSYLRKLQAQTSNMEIRNHVTQLVYQIIDTLLNYVAEIHSLKNQAGWSASSQLKESHKLWLDPYREDILFQQYRDSGEWQAEVCKDFGIWLNSKLNHKKMLFAHIESLHWAKLLRRQLREFERDMEIIT